MNSNILITVIIPAFNVEEWIERCISSVISQTYQNLEIIVIDDGSTDSTGELIDRFAEKDERIIAVHQENAGLIQVRERGISMATGDYIGFVDGDDEIEPDMYERLVKNALLYDAGISQCGILYCFYDGRQKPMHGSGELRVFSKTEGCRELLKGKLFEPSLCNKIYKKELLINSCADETVLNNEDLLRNMIVFSRCEKSVLEDFCGYRYWRRSESMSNHRDVVRIGNNLLQARKLILEHSIPEIKNEALESYLTAAISIYSRLAYRRGPEAAQLREKCISILKDNRSDMKMISSRIRMRAEAILHMPLLYNAAYKLHHKLKRMQTRKRTRHQNH